MMKLKYLPIVVLLYLVPTVCLAGPIDKIAELIKQGNAHELAKYFAASVDITVVDNTNVYSKVQAEVILEKFFKENKPLSIAVLHRVNSSATYNFTVYLLNTDKGKYRVACTMKEVEKAMVVIELRIETEKT
ncbi:DUF4783 domain-containing protein [Mucilaginibacter psychrotolerans]|uniref:DUF4783 domain-containing protein n=1 Tax=Mucilaginibacter psychrotolerans TaxID=1524096 RepID=A0A4Y8RXF1_9SPHI|nr:DUF4783 domain-containing protein [Mucilaginibacter psychrotolerans]TFF30367.1 DUF4783 domain-containing protein [Mucilaginibacter psychrotolerans]